MTKLSPSLSKTLEDSISEFKLLQSSADVAKFFEIPEGQLLYILYKLPTAKKYRCFEIPKKRGGQRSIKAPIKGTAILLGKLKPILEHFYRTKICVHGFVPKRSVVTNARQHVKKRYVLNIDLETFYDHINFGRVRGLFMAKPFGLGRDAATVLAQLCTHENSIPQGSPISPVLSNFIAAELDKKLMKLASKYGLRYSRYADDLTFSTSKSDFPRSFAFFEGNNPITGDTSLGKPLEDEISGCGFRVNHKKVRLQIRGVRQEVTGITVNEFPNVKRSHIRKIRAMIHAWKKHGLLQAEIEHLAKYAKSPPKIEPEKLNGTYFKNVIYGNLAYLKMVRGEDDELYMKLCLDLVELDGEAPKRMMELKKMHEKFDVFICHASEDKAAVALPIYDACAELDINAFLDIHYISWGDSLTEKINHALGRSKYVLTILSKNSIGKDWPSREINAALAREISGKQKILPLIVGNPDLSEIALIEDKYHITWDNDPKAIAHRIKELLYPKESP